MNTSRRRPRYDTVISQDAFRLVPLEASIDLDCFDGHSVRLQIADWWLADEDVDSPSFESQVLPSIEISLLLNKLNLTHGEKYCQVIRRHFGIGCPEQTLQEIGIDWKLTRERMRQLKEEALSYLREIILTPVVSSTEKRYVPLRPPIRKPTKNTVMARIDELRMKRVPYGDIARILNEERYSTTRKFTRHSVYNLWSRYLKSHV